MTSGIVVEQISKTYRRGLAGERVRALDGVSLSVAPGEAFGIIGPNGAGKTTFLGCLLGFLRPDSGRVTIDGRDPDDLAVRAVTGYLPERLIMDRWMNGRHFLAYHHALARLPAARRAADVEAALERVGLDPAAGDRAISRYSRGMLQRLGLAQALLGEPRYVFLDEPASGVDPAGVILFRRLIAELRERGTTVVLNSHQLDQVERVCDRVAYVSKGRVEAIETMTAGATATRVMRVRWTMPASATPSSYAPPASDATAASRAQPAQPTPEQLAAHAAYAGAALRAAGPSEARFDVPDDATSARLLHSLVSAGIPVVEAIPEESRLERLFLETQSRAATDTRNASGESRTGAGA